MGNSASVEIVLFGKLNGKRQCLLYAKAGTREASFIFLYIGLRVERYIKTTVIWNTGIIGDFNFLLYNFLNFLFCL